MRYTINFQHHATGAKVAAGVGMVDFNGAWLLPYEAAMLADALAECAEKAEDKAAQAAMDLRAELA
jgi:hypothetical protein